MMSFTSTAVPRGLSKLSMINAADKYTEGAQEKKNLRTVMTDWPVTDADPTSATAESAVLSVSPRAAPHTDSKVAQTRPQIMTRNKIPKHLS